MDPAPTPSSTLESSCFFSGSLCLSLYLYVLLSYASSFSHTLFSLSLSLSLFLSLHTHTHSLSLSRYFALDWDQPPSVAAFSRNQPQNTNAHKLLVHLLFIIIIFISISIITITNHYITLYIAKKKKSEIVLYCIVVLDRSYVCDGWCRMQKLDLVIVKDNLKIR
ncbi:hypothetical protein RIF29_42411 [Crotalaria pallida]|uniref:Transmembrane protein n=1 Tax=Crotalaria pallida TaxID=3830 RepID=A0AAN9E929_CROPI